MYRFLFSSKWLGYLLLAAIFATACVFLGRWQMDRRAETLAEINRVMSNYSATPVPFAEVRDEFSTLDPERNGRRWNSRAATTSPGQRIVRNSPLNGQPGYEVVVPFRLESGETVVIDRGWLPIGNNNPGRPDSIPAPPAGEVTAVVRLKAGEPDAAARRPRRPARLHRPARLRRGAGLPAADGRLRAARVGDARRGGHALPVPHAVHGGGHAPVLLAAVVRLRRADVRRLRLRRPAAGPERRDRRRGRRSRRQRTTVGGHALAAAAARRRPGPRKRKHPTAEEEEDAILDAQGY